MSDEPQLFKVPGFVETFTLVQSGLTFAEAAAIHKRTGHTPDEISKVKGLSRTPEVVQAFIWVSMKRVIPTLLFKDLDDVAMDAMEFVDDGGEDDELGPTPPPAGRRGKAQKTRG